MDSQKEKRLFEAVQKVFDSSLVNNFPFDSLDTFVDGEVMGFGTTVEEKITGLSGLRKLLEIQREQGKDLDLAFETKLIHKRIFGQENAAFFTHELVISMKVGGTQNILPLRFSTVF